MKILIALNHPAHYYLFKYIIAGLKKNNHTVALVVREKDILEKILISENQEYTKINEKKKRNKNVLSVLSGSLFELVIQDINLFKFVNKFKPQFMLGTDISISHIGRLKNIPSFVYNEDDFEINKLFCKATYPFANYIVSPEYTSVGKYEYKKIAYNGIQKMSYLNPKYFQPDFKIPKSLGIKRGEKYFIIRLVSLTSGHDIESKHTGISTELLNKLIPLLEKQGRVFITSEDQLSEELIKHQVKIQPNQMHHLMAFATLFIGDSQSMCAEAGILGTPFIRFNDFVGKIEYLNELENKYQLGWGVKTSQPEKVIELAEKIIMDDTIKDSWQQKRKQLYADKIDLNAFTIWLIENYPQSINTLKATPNHQYTFK